MLRQSLVCGPSQANCISPMIHKKRRESQEKIITTSDASLKAPPATVRPKDDHPVVVSNPQNDRSSVRPCRASHLRRAMLHATVDTPISTFQRMSPRKKSQNFSFLHPSKNQSLLLMCPVPFCVFARHYFHSSLPPLTRRLCCFSGSPGLAPDGCCMLFPIHCLP